MVVIRDEAVLISGEAKRDLCNAAAICQRDLRHQKGSDIPLRLRHRVRQVRLQRKLPVEIKL